MKPLADRFWPKVDIRGPDECWPWKQEHSHHPETGRGMIRPSGTDPKVPAPRAAYFLTHGVWPKVARHTCDNPPCCNPLHIVDGTQGDNNNDSVSRGRWGYRGIPGNTNARKKPGEGKRVYRKRGQ